MASLTKTVINSRAANDISLFLLVRLAARTFVLSAALILRSEGLATAADTDEYLSKALTQIESSLVTVPESYGLELVDTYKLHSNPSLQKLGSIKEGFGIYVSGDKCQFRSNKYTIKSETPTPYITNVELQLGAGDSRAIASMFTTKDGKVVSTLRKMNAADSYSLGQIDPYIFWMDSSRRKESPLTAPYQILANPCVAPLKVTPAVIRGWAITPLPNQDDKKVYDATGVHPDYPQYAATIKLFFSPGHGDALSRTEFTLLQTPSGDLVRREIRAVDAWKETTLKVFLPTQFSCQIENKNGVEAELSRSITASDINPIDPDKFDLKSIAEFNVKFDRIEDVAMIERRVLQESEARSNIPTKRSLTFWLVVIHSVAIAAGVLWFIRRRKQS